MTQSTGSSEDQSSVPGEYGKPDQSPDATVRELAPRIVSELESPGGGARTSCSGAGVAAELSAACGSEPTHQWLELIGSAIDDWPRTWRLVVLLVAASLSGATILFVLQLHADRWVSVTAVAASVIGAAGVRRRRSQSQASRRSAVTADPDGRTSHRRAGTSPGRSSRRAWPQG